jgi:exodeoxyribonuclease VIII
MALSKHAHIMIDTETLSQHKNAVIVSIGACKFSFEKGIFDEFYINIDAKDSKKHGLHIDQSTIDWWMKQDKAARNAWMVDPQPLKFAMGELTNWIGDANHNFWAHGASFDYPILESSWEAVGMKPQWKYWNLNDSRTIMNIAGINNKTLRSNDDTVYHNALEDSKAQTKVLIELLKDIM